MSSMGSLANQANPYDEQDPSENPTGSHPKERQIRPLKPAANAHMNDEGL
jgi:hypothetical protein